MIMQKYIAHNDAIRSAACERRIPHGGRPADHGTCAARGCSPAVAHHTNDNTIALRFYQRRGFDLVALHRDAVTRARAELKPSIPLEIDGIPLRHELELEMRLA